jgi:hypothetical protein
MNLESAIARTFGIVDRTLRREFPDDYDKRCMYAAFACSALLEDLGFDANIVGGDFLAFIVSTSGQRAGLQGFGEGQGQLSHFWVEIGETLIDVGPHYLPKGSSYRASPVPFVAWSRASTLPKFLRYRVQVRYARHAALHAPSAIVDRVKDFVAQCRDRIATQKGQPSLPSWILVDSVSLEAAAKRGDFWARNAMRFAAGVGDAQLPF